MVFTSIEELCVLNILRIPPPPHLNLHALSQLSVFTCLESLIVQKVSNRSPTWGERKAHHGLENGKQARRDNEDEGKEAREMGTT